KENINPHKPTRKHLHHTSVIDQHQPNRNSPQPLNIRPKTPTPTTNTTSVPASRVHGESHHHVPLRTICTRDTACHRVLGNLAGTPRSTIWDPSGLLCGGRGSDRCGAGICIHGVTR